MIFIIYNLIYKKNILMTIKSLLYKHYTVQGNCEKFRFWQGLIEYVLPHKVIDDMQIS